MKSIRPDRLVNSLNRFVIEKIDRRFIEPVNVQLLDIYKDTDPLTPIFFLVGHAANPYQQLLNMQREKFKLQKFKVQYLPLGKGQEDRVDKAIRHAAKQGK